jgi:hypothetical protein
MRRAEGRGPGAEELHQLTRRDALKTLGSVPMAAVLAVGTTGHDRASRFVQTLTEAEQQQQAAYAPKFFTAREWRTVRMLSDYVIPRDERSGSATDAKVPEYMDFFMADGETTEASRVSMRGGLAWIDNESRHRFGGKTFVESSDAERRQLLDAIAWPAKAKPEVSYGVTFFIRFRDMTASGFFSSAIGWKDLQYMGHTFVPQWNGCPPEALAKLGVSYDLMNSRASQR